MITLLTSSKQVIGSNTKQFKTQDLLRYNDVSLGM